MGAVCRKGYVRAVVCGWWCKRAVESTQPQLVLGRGASRMIRGLKELRATLKSLLNVGGLKPLEQVSVPQQERKTELRWCYETGYQPAVHGLEGRQCRRS